MHAKCGPVASPVGSRYLVENGKKLFDLRSIAIMGAENLLLILSSSIKDKSEKSWNVQYSAGITCTGLLELNSDVPEKETEPILADVSTAIFQDQCKH